MFSSRQLKLKPLVAGAFLFFAACTETIPPSEHATPTEAVKKFVELSASAKELKDRKALQAMTIGELKRAFDRMSDEDFKAHYLGEKITLQDLQIKVVDETKEKAKVRYTVTVVNQQGSDKTNEVNEREVILGASRGFWFIESLTPVGSDKIAFTKGLIL